MASRARKGEKTSLIKVNSELYNLIREFIKADPIKYPSIKFFVENAIRKSLGFKKYDIEGIDVEKIGDTPIEDVVGSPAGRIYAPCSICNRVFLNDLESYKKGMNVCNICSVAIMHVVDKIRKENKKERAKKIDKGDLGLR